MTGPNRVRIDLELKGEQKAKRGLKETGEAAEKAGDGLQEMARDAGFLDKRIGELRGEIRGLIQDFDRTGDKDLLKVIRKENRQLGQFTRLKKQFAELGDQSGKSFAGAFVDSLGNLRALKGPAIAGLAGLALAAAPFIGATIQAAVLGGVGGAGIIGGLALAARDSRVQDAAAELGKHAMDAFGRSAEPFIAPAIEAMGVLGTTVDSIAGDMRKAFSTIAPVLLPLTRGITGLVQEAMPGFLDAMEAARPIIRVLANEMPDLGRAISQFLSTVSEDPEGAIQAIRVLMRTLGVTIVLAGTLTKFLSRLFEGIAESAEKVGTVMDAVFGERLASTLGPFVGIVRGLSGATEEAKDSSGDFAGELGNVADSASDAEQEILQLQTAMDKFFGQTMGMHRATINYQKAIDDLTDSVQDNGRSMDAGTEKGQANRGAVLDQIQAIKDLRDATINQTGNVEAANATYDRQLEALRRTAINLGLNKTEVNNLINAYKGLPEEARTSVQADGLAETLRDVRELLHLMQTLSGATGSGALAGALSFGGGRAHGGPVTAGQTYVVGENGPEVLHMGSQSGRVLSNQQSQQMLSGMSGGMSMGATTIVLRYEPTGDRLIDALMEQIIKQVRIDGGDTSVFGRG